MRKKTINQVKTTKNTKKQKTSKKTGKSLKRSGKVETIKNNLYSIFCVSEGD